METQHKRVQDLENELNEYKKRKVNLINELHKEKIKLVEMCGGSENGHEFVTETQDGSMLCKNKNLYKDNP